MLCALFWGFFFYFFFTIFYIVLGGVGIGVGGLGRADYSAFQVVVSTQLMVNGPTYYLSDTKAGL